MKILLISPSSDGNFYKTLIKGLPFMDHESFFAPYSCAVIAALTPRKHDVSIYDESLHGPVDRLIMRKDYDIIGISLVPNELRRTIELLKLFRDNNRPGLIAVGGVSTLNFLRYLREYIDVAFIGEAEETWPKFLQDVQNGNHKSTYRQIAKNDMSLVPVPRWDLIGKDIPRYSVAPVQTARGCHHDCNFCDVIYNFGRKLRVKPIGQVIEEVRVLQSLKVEMIYFSDDNFAADRKNAKALLRQLIQLNQSFETPIFYATQTDITIAEDDELLQLMLDANIIEVQIGIESTDQEALECIHKTHNLHINLVEAVKKIQSYGIVVLAHMIIGIDSDDTSAFQRSARFLKEAHIVHHAGHPLMAPRGSRLWYELKRQSRLIDVDHEMYDKMDITTNIVPKQMTRMELIDGIAKYRVATAQPLDFLNRAIGFIKGIEHRSSLVPKKRPIPWTLFRKLYRMVKYYTLQAPFIERWIFFKLLGETTRHAPEHTIKVIYAHICHLMEYQQSKLMTQMAEELMEKERSLPEGVTLLSPVNVSSDAIRRDAKKIVHVAFSHVRPEVKDRETLYQVVLAAMVDYTDRYGETFETFDDYQRDGIEKSCEIVLNKISLEGNSEVQDIPQTIPAGFAREILDAMDQTKQFNLNT